MKTLLREHKQKETKLQDEVDEQFLEMEKLRDELRQTVTSKTAINNELNALRNRNKAFVDQVQNKEKLCE